MYSGGQEGPVIPTTGHAGDFKRGYADADANRQWTGTSPCPSLQQQNCLCAHREAWVHARQQLHHPLSRDVNDGSRETGRTQRSKEAGSGSSKADHKRTT